MTGAGADQHWMQQALHLAAQGLFCASPNPRVGCVIVKSGQAVGSGWHPGTGEPHAEVYALRDAGDAARGATAYVNLEPCSHHGRTPPCADALIDAGVARVVVANTDPNPKVSGTGLERLRKAGIEVLNGVLWEQGEALNRGFFKRMRQGRPWVSLKLAHSLDGRTAMASGESQWITGQAARADVQYWRARSCAVLTGADTLLHDQSRLQVREDLLVQRWPDYPPLGTTRRLVIDSHLRVPANHPFFAQTEDACVVCGDDSPQAALQPFRDAGIQIEPISRGHDGHLQLDALLDTLGRQGVNELLVECGPTLAGAWIQAGLVDECILYCAPIWLGSEGRPVAELPYTRMNEALPLKVLEQRQFGDDWRIIASLQAPQVVD